MEHKRNSLENLFILLKNSCFDNSADRILCSVKESQVWNNMRVSK